MATVSQMKKGLTLRPTYDQILLSYLSGGSIIKKPDRTARFIRESPQYQDLLKTDFIDLQKQQNNILKAQKKDVLLKEMAKSDTSSMKSVLASENGNGDSAAYQSAVDSDLDSINSNDQRIKYIFDEYEDSLHDYEEQQQRKKERGQQLIQGRLDEVRQQHEYLGGLRESFAAAKATGYEPVPSTGDKALDKIITKRQQEGDVLVLPASPDNPSYISQLSKNPEAIERQRQRLGLSQAASSSSASPARYDIGTTSEARNYLESLSFTDLKKEARASNVRVPPNMRKADKSELIDKLLKRK